MSTDYTHLSKLSFDQLFARKGPNQEVQIMDSDGNLTGINNISSTGTLSVTSVATTAGITAGTTISATGNVTGANLSGTNTGDQTITLTGDVTGSGTGSFATTVATVGTSTATNIHSAEVAANAATSSNTVSTIVKRDGSGNFSAGTITAALSGNATTATTATNFSGSLSGDVTGTQSATSISNLARSKIAAGTADHVVINATTTGALSSEAQLAKTRGGTGISSTATFPSSGTVATVPSSGVVHSDGTALSSSAVVLTSEVSGVLPIANGGTNSSTALNNNRIIQSSSSKIVEAAAITASRALISDANGIPTHATTTSTEIGYVNGVTSAIQTQIDNGYSPTTYSDVNATLAGLKPYFHGTSYNGSIAPTVTSSVSGFTCDKAEFVPWKDQAGNWYMRIQIQFSYSLNSHATADLTINGVTFANEGSNGWALSAIQQNDNTTYNIFCFAARNNTFIRYRFSTSLSALSGAVTGWAKLLSKPTWAY